MAPGDSTTSTPWPIAASGMPNTADDCSSCAIASPPARCTAAAPAAPSLPIPLSTIATAARPAARAMLLSSTSPDGRYCRRGGRASVPGQPAGDGEREVPALGARASAPGCSRVPASATPTGSAALRSSQLASASVNPGDRCCTIRIGIGIVGRQRRRARNVSIWGPPADAQMPTTATGGPAGVLPAGTYPTQARPPRPPVSRD